ncbi:hypothetical protein [Luteolibacter marinus]|uniref:hypothetical protein n=1 Tax=Luteolibacter marinus TaxID=2776705 RepID=UPI001867D02D|nr:hypothetical protein [Luteolibacter marinus]
MKPHTHDDDESRCPALSDRSRTFASIAHAAASLGLPVDALRLAKHHGCPGFRPNGSVNERELVEWLLFECRQFWSDPLASLGEDWPNFPEEARAWRETPPEGCGAASVDEGAFQWLRLLHGDDVMARAKETAEGWLRQVAATVPAPLLDGSATLPPIPGDWTGPLGDLCLPARFPAAVPAWRLDLHPFSVLQADRVEFWQWTDIGVRDIAEINARRIYPEPPRFLVIRDDVAEQMPIKPRNCADYRFDHRLWDSQFGEPRCLLDFLPPATDTKPGASRPRRGASEPAKARQKTKK